MFEDNGKSVNTEIFETFETLVIGCMLLSFSVSHINALITIRIWCNLFK